MSVCVRARACVCVCVCVCAHVCVVCTPINSCEKCMCFPLTLFSFKMKTFLKK